MRRSWKWTGSAERGSNKSLREIADAQQQASAPANVSLVRSFRIDFRSERYPIRIFVFKFQS